MSEDGMKVSQSQPESARDQGLARGDAEPSAALARLQALAQHHLDASNDRKLKDYQRRAHAHAWGGVQSAITVLRECEASPATDVVRLVIAARQVAYESPTPEALHELDEAAEAFAARVPWDDEPEAEGATGNMRSGAETDLGEKP